MAGLFWEYRLPQTPKCTFVRFASGAPQGSLGHRPGPESEQSTVAVCDRLARQLTVVAPSFVPTLDVRPRQSLVGCLTRAVSSTRYNSQKLAG